MILDIFLNSSVLFGISSNLLNLPWGFTENVFGFTILIFIILSSKSQIPMNGLQKYEWIENLTGLFWMKSSEGDFFLNISPKNCCVSVVRGLTFIVIGFSLM